MRVAPATPRARWHIKAVWSAKASDEAVVLLNVANATGGKGLEVKRRPL